MRIAGEMGGFTLGDADQLRRAMGKKKLDLMADYKVQFVQGAIERGVDEQVAAGVFDLMAEFAKYGFNKSHSAAYAVLAVQTAWLKKHWPQAFMASAMTSEMGTTDRVVTLAEEVRRTGLTLHPPDVNTCTADFRPTEDGVRYGLGAIKNVGLGAIEAIVDAREELGRPFRDLYEFCDVIDPTRVNRRVVEALILAGALDALPGRREQMVAALDLAWSRAQRRARDRARGQTSLFGDDTSSDDTGLDDSTGVLPDVAPWSLRETLARERELTGMYLSAHPLDDEHWLLRRLAPFRVGEIQNLDAGRTVACIGVVTARKVISSKKTGRLIAFVGFEDLSGSQEAVVFSDTYDEQRQRLALDDPLLFVVRTSRREGEEDLKLNLEDMLTFDEALHKLVRGVSIDVDVGIDEAASRRVLDAVEAHPGETMLTLRLREDGEEFTDVRVRRGVRPSLELLHALVDALGEDAVDLDLLPISQLAVEKPRPWQRREAAASKAA